VPASTSPLPAVARALVPAALMVQRPSGAAMTVPGPFSTHTAPQAPASRSAAAIGSSVVADAGVDLGEQGARLAGMGREHDAAVRARGLANLGQQRAGVEDDATARPGEQSRDGLGVCFEPGTDHGRPLARSPPGALTMRRAANVTSSPERGGSHTTSGHPVGARSAETSVTRPAPER
jgi:hypothetical protein